jgi:hypothetical protein
LDNIARIGEEIGNDNWLSDQMIMAIMTVTRENFSRVKDDAMNLISMGFVKLDIFPNMLEVYSDDEIKVLREQLISLKELIRKMNILSPKINVNLNWTNRIWSEHCLSKILLCSDGIFYLLDGINMLPYDERKSFAIGSVETGMDINKREKIYRGLDNIVRKNTPTQYIRCEFSETITFPIQLYLWCVSRKKDFRLYFDSFMKISELFLELT